MHEIATLQFTANNSEEKALAIVRATQGQIALCISLEADGDVEITISPQDGKLLIAALQQAVSVSSEPLE